MACGPERLHLHYNRNVAHHRPSSFRLAEDQSRPYHLRIFAAWTKKTTRPDLPDLLDANVWIALSVADHLHHATARRYWTEQADKTR